MMQKIIYLLLVVFLFVACSKAKNSKFVASAELNGELLLNFDATFHKGDEGLFTLFLSVNSESGPDQKLKFFNFEKEVGRTIIFPSDSARDLNLANSSYSVIATDLLLDYHRSIKHDLIDSWIEIDDIGYRKIEGRFQVVVERSPPSREINLRFPYLVDTLIFKEGTFVANRVYR